MSGFSASGHRLLIWLSQGRRRIVAAFLGLALLATGCVATFLSSNGAGSATIIASGAIFLLLALLDERISSVKVGDFELQLREVAQQLSLNPPTDLG